MINKNKKYLIACSGGPDSMALLQMSRKQLKYIEVAHVNYHKRKTANRDEKIVADYCKKYKIKLHVLNVSSKNTKGNFQAFAREIRYSFFSDVCKKRKLDCVLVAHHKDDLIETYYMQLEKKLGVNYYGLSENIILYGVNVKRPLLTFTKAELEEYCDLNDIEYGIDESNLTDNYTRNKIRHDKIEKLSNDQKDDIVNKIELLNKKICKEESIAINTLTKKQSFTVKEFLNIRYLKRGLRYFFNDISNNFYEEILRQIKYSKKFLYKGDVFWISKEYNKIYLFDRPIKYSDTFRNIKSLNRVHSLYYKTSNKGDSRSGVYVKKSDFPLTVRNVETNDLIKLNFGTKKINRFFIDKKILIKDREIWPIVINSKGDAILVPGLGCDKEHYSKKFNLYVLKL